jgi:solute carrier family 35 protein E1
MDLSLRPTFQNCHDNYFEDEKAYKIYDLESNNTPLKLAPEIKHTNNLKFANSLTNNNNNNTKPYPSPSSSSSIDEYNTSLFISSKNLNEITTQFFEGVTPWFRSYLNYETLRIIILVVVWYTSSALSNNGNKAILDVFPSPMTLTLFQSVCVAIYAHIYLQVFYEHPQVLTWKEKLKYVYPLSLCHLTAMLLTHISLRNVPVSFTHTIKSMSPVCSAFLSYLILHQRFTLTELLSLVPIIGGILMCSVTEINFNSLGLVSAIGSSFLFSLQNICTKKMFTDRKIDHVTFMYHTSLAGAVILFPIWAAFDGRAILQSPPAAGVELFFLYLFNSLCHFCQSISAFSVLLVVMPLSYSIANTSKRLFVIVSSIIWFGNKVSTINMFGICISLIGVLLYNRAQLLKRSNANLRSHNNNNNNSNSNSNNNNNVTSTQTTQSQTLDSLTDSTITHLKNII